MNADLSASIQQILAADTPRLVTARSLEISSARIEVQCLLQAVLHVTRAYLLAHPERMLSVPELAHYHGLMQRRLAGEPIAYILGEREFYGLNFKVTPATLIPRPDTELLVELALQRIPKQKPCRVLDMGTGSGAIALAIAHACPHADVVASDASVAALAVAVENARALGLSNVNFVHSDWFAAIGEQQFDLIVSNPPYIEEDDPHLKQHDVRYEPVTALVSGAEGLDDIRKIIRQSAVYLAPGGWLLLEHGYDQSSRVRQLFEAAKFDSVFSACDLAGIERASGGRIAA